MINVACILNYLINNGLVAPDRATQIRYEEELVKFIKSPYMMGTDDDELATVLLGAPCNTPDVISLLWKCGFTSDNISIGLKANGFADITIRTYLGEKE